ncbi:MAG: Clp protease ClpP [Clostridia bacterium]|nr:Clp protease ClpP [Clostridia bacterium]
MKLKVKGDIIPNDYKFIYDWIGWEHCCPSDAETAVDACADGETLEVEISSGGGYVHAGAEIYTAIRGYRKGEVRIAVTGLAASAASVIAMAGYCEMSPAALMMIHNVSCSASGDYRDMEQAAEILRENNDALITAYAAKTGRSHDELQRLMDAETWMSANRAVELGFADGILASGVEGGTSGGYVMTAAESGFRMLSPEVVERLRGIIDVREPDIEKARHELEFLNLKGKVL